MFSLAFDVLVILMILKCCFYWRQASMSENMVTDIPISGSDQDAALEDSMFKTIMKYSQDSIYFKDRDCRFIIVNNIKAQKHGVDPAQMIGKTDFDYFSADIAAEIHESEKMIMEAGIPVIGKIEKLTRLDGPVSWSSSSKYPLYDNSGKVIGIWGISRDITESELAKEALCAAEMKLEKIITNISDVITIADITGKILYMSTNIEKQFGWTSSDLAGKIGLDFIHPDDRDQLVEAYRNLVRNNVPLTSIECRYRRKDGIYIPVKVSAVNMLRDPNIAGILINYHDISERRNREEEIFYLSYHDVLTGLYNRAFFDEECKRLNTMRQLPISIIMGDVNGLKLTNDAFGHAEGDKLLIEIALILRLCCRAEDIIARIGGDEFSILLPRTNSDMAQTICERIYRECENRKHISGNKSYYPSISLGHTTKTELHVSIDSLRKDAEDFMYRRKLLEQNSMHSSLISSIRATMNERGHETEEHSERMIVLSVAMGKSLHLPEDQLFELDLLSRLHDIGKIGIEEYILSKPDKLTPNEWTKVKLHPEVGCRIAQSSPDLIGIAYYILCHHEFWNGEGYPQGLHGEIIPLLSRIISIVDAFDAMTQDRPYRKAISVEKAIDELREQSGKQFDPSLTKVFVEDVLGIPWVPLTRTSPIQ